MDDIREPFGGNPPYNPKNLYKGRTVDSIDAGYGDYKTIHDYLIEPERIGYLKAVIRSKKQVIQMLTRELMELEGELNNEVAKFNIGKS